MSNMSSAKFITDIVCNILNKPISSKDYKTIGGSPNIFRLCVERNKGIGEQCAFALANLIIQETKFDDLKRKMVYDYIKQYLTAKEQDYMNKNITDIKTIVRFASMKFSKRNRNSMPDINKLTIPMESMRIVGIDELFKMGWTVYDFIKGIEGLWRELIPDIPDEHIGDREKWAKIHTEHSESRKALLNNKNQMIGYWEFDVLFSEVFEKAKNGELLEGEMSINDIPFMFEGTYNIYFENICIIDKSKTLSKSVALRKMLHSIISTIEELALDNIFINEICTWAYTGSGIALCKSLGLKFFKKHEEVGEIYLGTIHDLLSHPICNEFPTLKDLYKIE